MKAHRSTILAFLREAGESEIELVVVTDDGIELTLPVSARMALNWIEQLAAALRTKQR